MRDKGNDPTYKCWAYMVRGCDDPTRKGYAKIGGAGIGYCKKWATFKGFLSDMGEKPAKSILTRVDVDRGFCPSNCYWHMVDNWELR